MWNRMKIKQGKSILEIKNIIWMNIVIKVVTNDNKHILNQTTILV